MASIKIWYLLGIILLGSLQFAMAQLSLSAEDENPEDASRAFNDSNEEQNGGSNAEQDRQLFKNLLGRNLLGAAQSEPPRRAQQAQREEAPTRFESAEEEDDYDPIRDNFFDRNEDGTYVYGYSLPHGVRRYERSFYSEKYKGLVVEGFYTQKRQFGQRLAYELRCYRADAYGYRPLPVEYLSRPPVVEGDEEPDVNCFDN